MNEPTEIKYPLDENGEPYFAATHIKGVAGIDMENYTKQEDLSEFNDKFEKMENRISEQDVLIANLQKEIQKLQIEKVESE